MVSNIPLGNPLSFMAPALDEKLNPPFSGRILVHMCCGPCSVYPLKLISSGKAEVWGFFHNPNIHPYSEFRKRLEAVRLLSRLLSLNVIFDESYRPTGFMRGARGAGGEADGSGRIPGKGKRCRYCYSTRLEETAKAARREGFDAFTTSLLYSKYQDHDGIKAAGQAISLKYGLPFIYADFRAGWHEGINGSREMGLYRQKWCGCIWSKIERGGELRAARPKKGATGA